MKNVLFDQNTATWVGGGMYTEVTSSTGGVPLLNLTFSRNYAAQIGGGVVLLASTMTMKASQFTDNAAGMAGGGLVLSSGITYPLRLEEVTFERNRYGVWVCGSRRPRWRMRTSACGTPPSPSTRTWRLRARARSRAPQGATDWRCARQHGQAHDGRQHLP